MSPDSTYQFVWPKVYNTRLQYDFTETTKDTGIQNSMFY